MDHKIEYSKDRSRSPLGRAIFFYSTVVLAILLALSFVARQLFVHDINKRFESVPSPGAIVYEEQADSTRKLAADPHYRALGQASEDLPIVWYSSKNSLKLTKDWKSIEIARLRTTSLTGESRFVVIGVESLFQSPPDLYISVVRPASFWSTASPSSPDVLEVRTAKKYLFLHKQNLGAVTIYAPEPNPTNASQMVMRYSVEGHGGGEIAILLKDADTAVFTIVSGPLAVSTSATSRSTENGASGEARIPNSTNPVNPQEIGIAWANALDHLDHETLRDLSVVESPGSTALADRIANVRRVQHLYDLGSSRFGEAGLQVLQTRFPKTSYVTLVRRGDCFHRTFSDHLMS